MKILKFTTFGPEKNMFMVLWKKKNMLFLFIVNYIYELICKGCFWLKICIFLEFDVIIVKGFQLLSILI